MKSTPSIILIFSTDTKGTKLYIFIFCTVLFPFLTIVDEKYSCLKLASIVKGGKFLVWLLILVCVTICIYESY